MYLLSMPLSIDPKMDHWISTHIVLSLGNLPRLCSGARYASANPPHITHLIAIKSDGIPPLFARCLRSRWNNMHGSSGCFSLSRFCTNTCLALATSSIKEAEIEMLKAKRT
jgi:hypothetical protein